MRPWPQNPGKVTEAAAFSQSSRGLARNRAAGHQTRMQLDRAAAPVASTSLPLPRPGDLSGGSYWFVLYHRVL